MPATADIDPTHCGIRVERRIEIAQVNALGRDAVAKILEVVAIIREPSSRGLIIRFVRSQ